MNNVFSSNTKSKKNKKANGFNINAISKAFDSFILALYYENIVTQRSKHA